MGRAGSLVAPTPMRSLSQLHLLQLESGSGLSGDNSKPLNNDFSNFFFFSGEGIDRGSSAEDERVSPSRCGNPVVMDTYFAQEHFNAALSAFDHLC